MKSAKKILAAAMLFAVYSVGVVAFARPPAPAGATLAHEVGPSGRHAIRGIDGPNGCGTLPGNAAEGPAAAPANMRYWCTRCIQQGGQHYHADCPAGARCSPNNGAVQCGGGQF